MPERFECITLAKKALYKYSSFHTLRANDFSVAESNYLHHSLAAVMFSSPFCLLLNRINKKLGSGFSRNLGNK